MLFTAASTADSTMLSMDPYLEGLTAGPGNFTNDAGQPDSGQQNLLRCYTPPDSVKSASPSPSGIQADMAASGHPTNDYNFDCTPLIVSSTGPPLSCVALPPTPFRSNSPNFPSASLPVTGRLEERLVESRLASRRPQLTSAKCSQASIEIMNPKEEYDKVQKKHGPKGRYSEQRIANGQV